MLSLGLTPFDFDLFRQIGRSFGSNRRNGVRSGRIRIHAESPFGVSLALDPEHTAIEVSFPVLVRLDWSIREGLARVGGDNDSLEDLSRGHREDLLGRVGCHSLKRKTFRRIRFLMDVKSEIDICGDAGNGKPAVGITDHVGWPNLRRRRVAKIDAVVEPRTASSA